MLYKPLYNLLKPQLVIFRDYIVISLKKEWIRFSISFTKAFILFVPKKNGSLKLYINYRGFNKVTIKNQYFLLLIDETLDCFISTQIFTKLNLKNAYY